MSEAADVAPHGRGGDHEAHPPTSTHDACGRRRPPLRRLADAPKQLHRRLASGRHWGPSSGWRWAALGRCRGATVNGHHDRGMSPERAHAVAGPRRRREQRQLRPLRPGDTPGHEPAAPGAAAVPLRERGRGRGPRPRRRRDADVPVPESFRRDALAGAQRRHRGGAGRRARPASARRHGRARRPRRVAGRGVGPQPQLRRRPAHDHLRERVARLRPRSCQPRRGRGNIHVVLRGHAVGGRGRRGGAPGASERRGGPRRAPAEPGAPGRARAPRPRVGGRGGGVQGSRARVPHDPGCGHARRAATAVHVRHRGHRGPRLPAPPLVPGHPLVEGHPIQGGRNRAAPAALRVRAGERPDRLQAVLRADGALDAGPAQGRRAGRVHETRGPRCRWHRGGGRPSAELERAVPPRRPERPDQRVRGADGLPPAMGRHLCRRARVLRGLPRLLLGCIDCSGEQRALRRVGPLWMATLIAGST
mmetsp:Transcript_104660/g.296170  ORF Transcript_104660/g.296170 Transcript_104660/m.296170 type:complete len:476 (+) Transcript_104660:112-1539(+)